MHASHRPACLSVLGVTSPLAAQQALPLPRVEREMEARMQDTPRTAFMRHRCVMWAFEASGDGAPRRYQGSVSAGMGGDMQHSERRPAGARAMVTLHAAERVTRRANAASSARYRRPTTDRGSLPANGRAAGAGDTISAQISHKAMPTWLCACADQDAARADDQAGNFVAQMLTDSTNDPQASTMWQFQICQPELRGDLALSIASGAVF